MPKGKIDNMANCYSFLRNFRSSISRNMIYCVEFLLFNCLVVEKNRVGYLYIFQYRKQHFEFPATNSLVPLSKIALMVRWSNDDCYLTTWQLLSAYYIASYMKIVWLKNHKYTRGIGNTTGTSSISPPSSRTQFCYYQCSFEAVLFMSVKKKKLIS